MAELFNQRAQSKGLPPPVSDSTMTKPPSAELAPDQTDEDTLPPYALLDDVLRNHIEGGLNADDLVEHGFDEAVVVDVLRRLERNEHKRWQMPPLRASLRVRLAKVGAGPSLRITIGVAPINGGALKKWMQ